MFGGAQAKAAKRQQAAEELARKKAAAAEAELHRQHMLAVRERLERFKREEFVRAIAEEESMEDLKDMCTYLLEQLNLTHRALPLKHLRLRVDKGDEDRLPQCEIRSDTNPDAHAVFDCRKVLVTEIAEKFDFPDLGDLHPWLEAVNFSDCPWEAEKEPPNKPLILFPSGDLPEQEEVEEEDPPYFNLSNSVGVYYILHTNVSCRGKLFAQIRSISKAPPDPDEEGDEDDEYASRFTDGI